MDKEGFPDGLKEGFLNGLKEGLPRVDRILPRGTLIFLSIINICMQVHRQTCILDKLNKIRTYTVRHM